MLVDLRTAHTEDMFIVNQLLNEHLIRMKESDQIKLSGVYFVARFVMEDITETKPELAEGSAALISINEPDNNPSPATAKWRYKLVLNFWDIPERAEIDGKWYETITKEQAKQIVEFVEQVKDEVGMIIVQCAAGISRSAAVAKFIAEKYNVPNIGNNSGKFYNRLVYKLLQQVNEERK